MLWLAVLHASTLQQVCLSGLLRRALGVLDSFIQTAARKVHPFESSASCEFDLVFNPGIAIHSCNYTSSTKHFKRVNKLLMVHHTPTSGAFDFLVLLKVLITLCYFMDTRPLRRWSQIYPNLRTFRYSNLGCYSISGWLEHVGIMGTIKTSRMSRAFEVYCAVTRQQRQQRDPGVHLSGLSASNDFEYVITGENWSKVEPTTAQWMWENLNPTVNPPY